MVKKLKTDDLYKSTLYRAAREITGALSVPINIEQICQRLKISIKRRNDLQGKALLEDTPSGLRISLPARNNPLFERFMIAHELGHFILRQELSVAPLGASEYWRHEVLCHYFAQLVLLPDHYIQPLITGAKLNVGDLLSLSDTLSKHAHVMWITAAYRITDICPEFVFLDLRIQRQTQGPPYFFINASTIPNRKVQRGKASLESGLGRLLAPLITHPRRLVFNGNDLEKLEIIKQYPVFSEVKAGIAERYSHGHVRLALQLHGQPNDSINQIASLNGQRPLFPIS
jgi:hypothetical protein